MVVGTTVPARGTHSPLSGRVARAADSLFSTMVCRLVELGGVSIDRMGDARVVPDRSTIARHDRPCCAMVSCGFP